MTLIAREDAARSAWVKVPVCSGQKRSGSPLVANYAATKGYIATLALSLAAELDPAGVDVMAVCPGMIRTPATEADPPRLDRAPWVRMLDAEDKNWREDTVILWDNASYHTNQARRGCLRDSRSR